MFQKANVMSHVNGHTRCAASPPPPTQKRIRLETKVELESFAAFVAQIQQTSVTGGVNLLPKHS